MKENSQKKTRAEYIMCVWVWGTGQSIFVSHWKCVWWVCAARETTKGPEIRLKTCKPFVLNRVSSSLNHTEWCRTSYAFRLSPSSRSITGWAEVSGGSGRCAGMTASLRRWTTSATTAGGPSCEKACCWSERPGRRDAAGSGWKSRKRDQWLLRSKVRKLLNI